MWRIVTILAGVACTDVTNTTQPAALESIGSVRVTLLDSAPPEGGTTAAKAVVIGDRGTVIASPVQWRVANGAIAQIDTGGRIVALTPGQTEIVARAGSHEGRARLDVRLVAREVSVTIGSRSLSAGTHTRATASAVSISGARTSSGIWWASSNSSVASVDSTGQVIAVAPGVAEVIAVRDGVSARTAVEVLPQYSRIDVTLLASAVASGQSTLATAVAEDHRGHRILPEVEWVSSDPRVATVDAQGRISAVGTGTTTIVAQGTGVLKTATLRVNPAPNCPDRRDDEYFLGDWDGDGTKTLATRRGAVFCIDNNGDGFHDAVLVYGHANDSFVVGRWGCGTRDYLGVYRNHAFLLDTNGDGTADITYRYGQQGDIPVVGDWDGDGCSNVGVRRGARFFLDTDFDGRGQANLVFDLGYANDRAPVVADFNGDGRDDLAIFRRGWFFMDLIRGGQAEDSVAMGYANDIAMAGDMNGDKRGDLVIQRGPTFFVDISRDGVAEFTQTYGYGVAVGSQGRRSTLSAIARGLGVAVRTVTSGAIALPVELLRGVNGAVAGIPQVAIERTLGADWARAFASMTSWNRVQFELWLTGADLLARCAGGASCDPSQLVGLPVAAALRDAYKVYGPSAVPMPLQFAEALRGVVPPHLLRARWVVANPPDFSSLPGFLNSVRGIGAGHAVTVGDVIIFDAPLDFTKESDWLFALHELAHVEQYFERERDPLRAIDDFSLRYVRAWTQMERAADLRALEWWEQIRAMYQP